MKTSLIVAVARNGAIGKDNAMLWHIPEDFKYFKAVTMGKPIIMGRKTFESIGRPLPGRLNIVITRNEDWHADKTLRVSSLEHAIEAAKTDTTAKNAEEIMIIGGAQIYQQALPFVQRVYYTAVHQDYDHDAAFPPLSSTDWAETSREDHQGDGEQKPAYSFIVYERK